ncbi:hypothetical protein SAMN05421636_102196 [Pricia antarctica]|uniref:Uncharacterized protein n=1 Tax=Pricia antarctica TaxID=641691 RepID=A0A1G6YD35_9FLAO|nr:hypothetical protein [Pricia antarctica]SDD87913.1 hypothetical protein SAMN05421636_102196 [Pricia antarctica]
MNNLTLKVTILFLLAAFTGCQKKTDKTLTAGTLNIAFNEIGALVSLSDTDNNRDYQYTDSDPKSILAIRVNGDLEYPKSFELKQEGKILELNYPKNGVDAEIKVVRKEKYTTFELSAITKKEAIELVLWGPFETKIKETIGETVGVVRNTDFAIGIQALNKRTIGGYPTNEDDSTPSYNIFGTTSLVDVSDSLNILYRGHTALPKEYGSSLQAYTRNRNNDRDVASMNHTHYSAPAFKDEGIVGSKIALFGCGPEEVLNTLEAIELGEGLPHPTLNGEWSKRSTTATSAYLIQDFGTSSIDDAIVLTKKAGLKYLYHSGPFENWGHFDLQKKSFPKNWESMKECVDKATEAGLKLGVHTLSNFITTNDPYVTPVPDDRLAKVGSSVLVNTITAGDKNIEIQDPTYFNQMENNSLHAVVIDTEIIRYESVSETAPWMLNNCQRGAFGTVVGPHRKGGAISKLADHAYQTFLTNESLGIEMANRIADLFNETGLKQISFDGLEGNYSTGMGAYGELLFVDAWYNKLQPEIKNDYIMDASRPGHYFWHMFTRMNWGEPWYAGFRESQTSLRLLNQDYFRRNFIPCMLGWFSMRDNTSLEDIEWMLARSAAFDAGYALVTSVDLVGKNGFGDEILEKIKQWERARMGGAFTKDQKKRMENIEDEFSLEKLTENSWNLVPYAISRFEHNFKIRQPGEPIGSVFQFTNEYGAQPLQFIITTKNVSASDITIELDNFKKIELNTTVSVDEYLKYTGGNEMVLYNKTWNKIKSIPLDSNLLELGNGNHKIKVDCSFSTKKEGAGLKLEVKTTGNPELVEIQE